MVRPLTPPLALISAAAIATDVVSAAAPSPVPRRNERRENLDIDRTSSLRVRSDFRSSPLVRQRQIVFSAAQALGKDFGVQGLVSILPFRRRAFCHHLDARYRCDGRTGAARLAAPPHCLMPIPQPRRPIKRPGFMR